jgi:hypothetical protein
MPHGLSGSKKKAFPSQTSGNEALTNSVCHIVMLWTREVVE